MASFLPRLGLAGIGGIGQMTPAQQSTWSKVRGAVSGKKKRRSTGKKKAAGASGGKKRRRKSKGGKLKKGSAAAKAYMAKIRKMRK